MTAVEGVFQQYRHSHAEGVWCRLSGESSLKQDITTWGGGVIHRMVPAQLTACTDCTQILPIAAVSVAAAVVEIGQKSQKESHAL